MANLDEAMIEWCRAIDSAIARRLSFFAVAEPGEALPSLWLENTHGDKSMTMCAFDRTRHPSITINARRVTPAELLAIEATGREIKVTVEPTTDRAAYIKGVNRVIKRLASRPRGEKVVISRVANIPASGSIGKIALSYFNRFGDTLRYIWNHPATGLWIGATPELLLDYSYAPRLESMAVAGTRDGSLTGPWDAKNRDEHDAVTRFITDTLALYCSRIDTGSDRDLRFGKISHLCTPITATSLDGVNVDQIIDALSPTPAVSGYPRPEALNEINQVEAHDRRYYGGYIKVGGKAWVNLRCASISHIDNIYNFTIYSGGGITASSTAADEWHEALSKSRPLVEAITCPQNLQLQLTNQNGRERSA